MRLDPVAGPRPIASTTCSTSVPPDVAANVPRRNARLRARAPDQRAPHRRRRGRGARDAASAVDDTLRTSSACTPPRPGTYPLATRSKVSITSGARYTTHRGIDAGPARREPTMAQHVHVARARRGRGRACARRPARRPARPARALGNRPYWRAADSLASPPCERRSSPCSPGSGSSANSAAMTRTSTQSCRYCAPARYPSRASCGGTRAYGRPSAPSRSASSTPSREFRTRRARRAHPVPGPTPRPGARASGRRVGAARGEPLPRRPRRHRREADRPPQLRPTARP